MTAIGLDIGGSKIEMQGFGPGWDLLTRERRSTPKTYDALLDVIAALVAEGRRRIGPGAPVGISLAGVIDPQTGLAVTSNLPATGRPLRDDLAARLGQGAVIVNDCRAMALSEARLGAGQGQARVLGLVLGTGVGGGFVQDGHLAEGATGIAGELGHIALPAAVVERHNLPLIGCGCGRRGCYETLVSGPGLVRIAAHLITRDLTAPEIATLRHNDPGVARVWSVWCDLLAELLVSAIVTLDPGVIVLGGGLSQVDGICDDLTEALARAHIPGLGLPQIRAAQGGDATGARGAALAAVLAMGRND